MHAPTNEDLVLNTLALAFVMEVRPKYGTPVDVDATTARLWNLSLVQITGGYLYVLTLDAVTRVPRGTQSQE